MKVRTRLNVSFGIILLLFFAAGGFFVMQSVRTMEALSVISSDFKIFADLFPVTKEITAIGTDFESAVISRKNERLDSAASSYKDVNSLLDNLEKSMVSFGSNSSAGSTAFSADKLATMIKEYYNTGFIMTKSFLGGYAENGVKMLENFEKEQNNLESFIDSFVKHQSDAVKVSLVSLEGMIRTFLLGLIAAAVSSIIIAFVLSSGLTAFIMKPLVHMADVSGDVAGGDLTGTVSYNKENVMGALGRNLNGAIASLRANTSEMKKVSPKLSDF